MNTSEYIKHLKKCPKPKETPKEDLHEFHNHLGRVLDMESNRNPLRADIDFAGRAKLCAPSEMVDFIP